jgi:hypothetical protein
MLGRIDRIGRDGLNGLGAASLPSFCPHVAPLAHRRPTPLLVQPLQPNMPPCHPVNRLSSVKVCVLSTVLT